MHGESNDKLGLNNVLNIFVPMIINQPSIYTSSNVSSEGHSALIDLNKFSNLRKPMNIFCKYYEFILKMSQLMKKSKVIDAPSIQDDHINFHKFAHDYIVRSDQKLHHIDEFDYLYEPINFVSFPILLSNKSRLSFLLIQDCYKRLAHSGLFEILHEIIRTFVLQKLFFSQEDSLT